ncbi:MAG: hypothetical protein ACK5IJ_02980 [Mangrovibacterium sp.]
MLRSRVSDWSGNPFKWALSFAHLKDCNGKRDGMARLGVGQMPAPPRKGMMNLMKELRELRAGVV